MNTTIEFPTVEGPTYREIWNTLSRIDVSKYVEKKNGLSYLSWAYAWGVLMEHFPASTFVFPEPHVHADGTVTVYCVVTVCGHSRMMWLPVMDYKNKPIASPNAFEMNTAMMRCMVKCLALHGLGWSVYAGEDLPAKDEGHTTATPAGDARERADRGTVTRAVNAIQKAVEADDGPKMRKILEKLSGMQDEFTVVWQQLHVREREYVDLVMDEIKRERAKEAA